MAFIDLPNVEVIDEASSDAKVLIVENGEIKRTTMPDLAKVEVIEEVSENAKMLIEENGEIKRTVMSSGRGVCIIKFTDDGYTPSWEEIEKTFFEGKNIFLKRNSDTLVPINTYTLDDSGALDQIASTDGCVFFHDGGYYDE